MAVNLDIFDSRYMLEAIDTTEAWKPKQVLTTTFFRVDDKITSTKVDVDIRKGARRVAPFVHYRREGSPVDKRGFQTRSYEPPYMKPFMVTDAGQYVNRQFGEPVYAQNRNLQDIAAKVLGEDTQELIDMINRRIELMSRQALVDGKIVVKGDGYDAEIDFLRDADNEETLAGGDLWSASTSNPPEHLLTYKRHVKRVSGYTIDRCFLGFDALIEFLNNEKVQKMLDVRRIELGKITYEDMPEGVTYYGRIHGIDIYSYDEWYLDDNGDEQPMIPAKDVILGCTQAPNMLHYGIILDEEAGPAAVPMFPKTWLQKNPPVRLVMVQSAPLIALHVPDSTFKATVLS